MKTLQKIINTTSIGSISLLYLLLSSINSANMMNGIQSGKSILFFYIIILICALSCSKLATTKRKSWQLSHVDIIILFWAGYTLFNNWHKEVSFSLRYGELLGLIVLYIVIRQIKKENLLWLYVFMILGGLLQAIYGNLQLWGYYPSHHSLFKMTGSFFNPGPYAGYLASIFPATLLLSLSLDKLKIPTHISNIAKGLRIPIINPGSHLNCGINHTHISLLNFPKVISSISLVIIALVIPASRSRSAWIAIIISSLFVLFFKYQYYLSDIVEKIKKRNFKWFTTIILISSSVLFLFIALYFYKPESANGRLLIWKISSNIIKDNLISGVGINQFKAHYMTYQASYFELFPSSPGAMIAGDTNYAFNELLQHATENGLIGLLLLLVIFIVSFLVKQNASSNKAENIAITPNLLVIAKAGLISIFVFSLFSYPFQILPIKINLILYLATIAHFAPKRTIKPFTTSHQNIRPVILFSKFLILGITTFTITYQGHTQLQNLIESYRNWNRAFHIYQVGAYEGSLEYYQKAYPLLKEDGDFLTNYGKALSMAEKHHQAIKVLELASKSFPNTIVYAALGNSYQSVGEIRNAEEAYLQACHMIPSRFYPLYLLAKLYNETGQNEKAQETAYKVLKKDAKVHSTAIEEIKEEMREIINRAEIKTETSLNNISS